MIVYVYRWKESLNMCLAYEIHLSCHIDKYQIKKHHIELNKNIEINQEVVRFRLVFPLKKAYICNAFRGKSSLTITLHHFNTYALPLQHKHCTTRTNNLHRFHCISKPPHSLPEERRVKSKKWKVKNAIRMDSLPIAHYSLLTFLCTSFIPTIGFSALYFVRSHLAEIARWEFF